MVDLPSIIETLKTVDMKTFYKTADLCQVTKEIVFFRLFAKIAGFI